MSRNLKQSSAIAYLRQLCCSGLDRESVIPEFLRAVQAVIPSGSNVYTSIDEKLKVSYFVLELFSDILAETVPLVDNYFTPNAQGTYCLLA